MNGRPRMPVPSLVSAVVVALTLLAVPMYGLADEAHALLGLMQDELNLSMEKLVAPDGTKPYFVQYWITDENEVSVAATLGSITSDNVAHSRTLDVDLRCGDYALDSTRQIRGGRGFDMGFLRGGGQSLPLNDDPLATRHAIWLATDSKFKDAVNRLAQVKANLKVKVEEEDPADDFSHEAPSVHISPWLRQSYDRAQLAECVKEYSRRFRAEPLIYSSSVRISGGVTNRLAVNSEGSKLQFGRSLWRISVAASTIADDGMELQQHKTFDSTTLEGLPSDDEVIQGVEEVIRDVLALRDAPVVEPYSGPAILLNRASAVFFHEIFGHRIEGHRQKDVEEGQTYAKKIGEEILPPFISVSDDPTRQQFNGIDLKGYYEFDDECVPAQQARLVENGVLKTFLMSRSPTRGVTKSNGHGRRQAGLDVCSRMGNTIIESTKQVPIEALRAMLIDECKKQGKDFGLLFTDILGGQTTTGRYSPQAFKVVPILVYKVYADGRPDELVRGVDIVGTPLTCFSQILCTGDDPDVFNGYCGAESGSIPVSGISPSILVEQIEVEKKSKSQDRPPIMPAPIGRETE
ncbi:MAG: TldD/PmbA family protein [Phycisphaerae bacterium]|nr:TldD/PmbA family protein [Phycisphaerae bacterium]